MRRFRDEFTPGLGGKRHIDVYLGEATGPGFTSRPYYTTLNDATLDVAPSHDHSDGRGRAWGRKA